MAGWRCPARTAVIGGDFRVQPAKRAGGYNALEAWVSFILSRVFCQSNVGVRATSENGIHHGLTLFRQHASSHHLSQIAAKRLIGATQ